MSKMGQYVYDLMEQGEMDWDEYTHIPYDEELDAYDEEFDEEETDDE